MVAAAPEPTPVPDSVNVEEFTEEPVTHKQPKSSGKKRSATHSKETHATNGHTAPVEPQPKPAVEHVGSESFSLKPLVFLETFV